MCQTELNFYEPEDIPIVLETSSVRDCLMEMNAKNCGFAFISNTSNIMVGLITDGDFRRIITKPNVNFSALMISDVKMIMKKKFSFIKSTNAVDAREILERLEINELPYLGDDNEIRGVFRVLKIRR